MSDKREEMKRLFWYNIWVLCMFMALVIEISRRDKEIANLKFRTTIIEQKLEGLK